MSKLISYINNFWAWVTAVENCNVKNVKFFPFDPMSFPSFIEMRELCVSVINTQLSPKEIEAFLLCMALDYEEEYILDECKERANKSFLHMLISAGIWFPQSETRWQIAELLRKDVLDRDKYLYVLLQDSDPYVRKRANNVILDDKAKTGPDSLASEKIKTGNDFSS